MGGSDILNDWPVSVPFRPNGLRITSQKERVGTRRERHRWSALGNLQLCINLTTQILPPYSTLYPLPPAHPFSLFVFLLYLFLLSPSISFPCFSLQLYLLSTHLNCLISLKSFNVDSTFWSFHSIVLILSSSILFNKLIFYHYAINLFPSYSFHHSAILSSSYLVLIISPSLCPFLGSRHQFVLPSFSDFPFTQFSIPIFTLATI